MIQIRAKGRGDMLRKRDLGWTDGRTEENFGCPSDPHIVWVSLISLYLYDAPLSEIVNKDAQ